MNDLFANQSNSDSEKQRISVSSILSVIHSNAEILAVVADRIGTAPDVLDRFLINNITYSDVPLSDSKRANHSNDESDKSAETVAKRENSEKKHMKAVLHTDGGSRGNPGTAGCGVAIDYDDGSHKGYYYYIGTKTNNEAEYSALIYGLSLLAEEGVREVESYSDSELMCNQINGLYKVKNENLAELYERVRRLTAGFDSFKISHVLRNLNKEADALANMAMDNKANGEIEHTVAG